MASPSGSASGRKIPTVFVIGDSISIHYGPHLEAAGAGFFHYDRKRGSSAENEMDFATGANGGDSARVLAYLKERQAGDPIRADILLLNCGLHDVKMPPDRDELQVPPGQYEQNLRAILAEADRTGLRVAWVRTTPVVDAIHLAHCSAFRRRAADVDAYNAIADSVMQGRPIFDLWEFSRRLGEEAFSDHVHYSPDARMRQGTFLAGCLHGLTAEPNC